VNPITKAEFRAFWSPIFGADDTGPYKDAWIDTYITVATILMNSGRWQTLYQTGMQYLVAHYITLFKKAVDDANPGGYPGLARGTINSETPGTVSVSYDTALSGEEGAGNYNLTQWGQQYIRCARLIGMGPIQLNTGCGSGAAGAVIGQMGAWPGPSVGSGFSF
jgi:hypothetical protein